MSAPRIGNPYYPNRVWEVWNDNYFRTDGTKIPGPGLYRPWTIFHPVIEPTTEDFATHAEAIAYLTAGDWDA